MAYRNPVVPRKRIGLARRSSAIILIPMILALAVASLVGCAGLTSASRPNTAPSSSALQILSASLPSASVGTGYNAALNASGGTPPYSWSMTSGSLPAGLQLSAPTGTISGTPTQSGSFSFKAQVQDAKSASTSRDLALSVSAVPVPAPTISSISPTSGSISGGTTVTISGSNFGPATVEFGSVAAAAVQLINSSQIRVVTPAESASTVSVTVQDSDGQTATTPNAFTFAGTPLQITTNSLPSATVGTVYSAALAASGGTPPYAWSTTSGALPAGLQLSASTGAISGTPGRSGSYSFNAQVQDAKSALSSVSLSVAVSPAPAPTISNASPTNGSVNGGTSVTISGANFRSGATVQFGGIAGSAIQVLNSSQIQTTTPAEASGTVSIKVQNSDGQSATDLNSFSFTGPALQIITNSLPVGAIGSNYSATLAASGGTPPYTWTNAGGALPAGLQLNSSTGTISGTPLVAGSSSFKAQVQDSKAVTSSVNLSLTVSPAPAPTISAVSPNTGSTSGGTSVIISGTNFHSGATVRFGNVPAASTQLVSSSQLQAVSPTETSGSVNVTVQDSDGQTATAPNAFTFTAPTLQITTNSLPGGTVGTAYSSTITATGGTPPYTWSTSSGSLPAGLQLNASSGTISGTPAAATTASFMAQVQDSKSVTSSVALSLKVSPTTVTGGPSISITAPSNGSPVSGLVSVSASATDSQSSITSVQFYMGSSTLGSPVTASPYTVSWDSTLAADGSHTLSALATDAAGNTATSAAITVTVNNSNWNPAVLGVSWSSDFNSIASNQINVKTDSRLTLKAKGDGTTDDTAAIRGAITLATQLGGAVVYFPTGDYKVSAPSGSPNGSPLVIPSRVVLRGATSATSRLFMNDSNAGSETDNIGTWGGFSFQGTNLSGMTDLGVFAVSSSSSPCALLWNRGSSNVSEIFFNNLDLHLTGCRNIWIESTNDILVQNSHINSSATSQGPIYIVGNSNVSFIGNNITYNYGRVHLQNSTNLLMQGNTLIRDAQNKDMDAGTAIESGGVELSFGQNVQVLNNSVQTLNAPASEVGDGEAIMNQTSNTPDVLDAGSATAVSSSTITDAAALWGSVTASRMGQFPEVVGILTGSAAGQWRTIQSINTGSKTITVSQPFSPVPEVGSLYTIFVWTLMNATIQGNTLTDNPNGIALWDGCYNCTVQNNTLVNSRGILLRTVDEFLDRSIYPEGRRVHMMAIDDKILNNTVSNTSGMRPAFVALNAEAFATDYYKGLGQFNIQVGGNIVNPYPANPNQVYPNNEISQDGLFPCFFFGPAPVKDPLTTVFQNINFWNNSQTISVTYVQGFVPLTTLSCTTQSAP